MEAQNLDNFRRILNIEISELSNLEKFHERSGLRKFFQLSLDLVTIEDWTLKIFS